MVRLPKYIKYIGLLVLILKVFITSCYFYIGPQIRTIADNSIPLSLLADFLSVIYFLDFMLLSYGLVGLVLLGVLYAYDYRVWRFKPNLMKSALYFILMYLTLNMITVLVSFFITPYLTSK